MDQLKLGKLKLLITSSILITKEEKNFYLNIIDSFSENQINELLQIFEEEKNKKKDLITEKIKFSKDSSLSNNLKKIRNFASREFLQLKEKKEQQKDSKKMENITQQINNFN